MSSQEAVVTSPDTTFCCYRRGSHFRGTGKPTEIGAPTTIKAIYGLEATLLVKKKKELFTITKSNLTVCPSCVTPCSLCFSPCTKASEQCLKQFHVCHRMEIAGMWQGTGFHLEWLDFSMCPVISKCHFQKGIPYILCLF